MRSWRQNCKFGNVFAFLAPSALPARVIAHACVKTGDSAAGGRFGSYSPEPQFLFSDLTADQRMANHPAHLCHMGSTLPKKSERAGQSSGLPGNTEQNTCLRLRSVQNVLPIRHRCTREAMTGLILLMRGRSMVSTGSGGKTPRAVPYAKRVPMDLTVSRNRTTLALGGLLALTLGTGTLQATTNNPLLLATSTSVPIILTCSTTGGQGSATVVIQSAASLTGTNKVVVTLGTLLPGISVTPAAAQTLNSTTTSITYTFTMTGAAAGCASLGTAAGGTFNFLAASNTGTSNTDLGVAVETVINSGLTVSGSPVTISCTVNGSTYTPGSAQNVSVTSAVSGGMAFTSSVSPTSSWLTVNPLPGGVATATPYTFTVAGCPTTGAAGSHLNATITLATASSVSISISVTLNLIAPQASSLIVTPNTISLTCTQTGSSSPYTYTPGPAQTVAVTAPASTAFTVSTSLALPTWLGVSSTSGGSFTGGTASSTAVQFQVVPQAGCGNPGALLSTQTATIHLSDPPALDQTIPVTLQIVSASPLTAAPSSPSLSYTKGSGVAAYKDVVISSSTKPSPNFQVDTSTLPAWLNVNLTTGTASATGTTVRFSSTSVADSLAPGRYSGTVNVKASGYAVLPVTFSLSVTNPAPKLSVDSTSKAISWTVGQPSPTSSFTLTSSDSPIAYSIKTGGSLAPIISSNELSGLAYSFGTTIQVTFNPLVFAAATPGTVLTGTATITWGSLNATIVVTFSATIVSPGAIVTGISPASLPTAVPGTKYYPVLTGSGFVVGTDPTQKTVVGVVPQNSTTMQTDTNVSATVLTSSTIALTITVPATTDLNLPFSPSGPGGPVTIGVCNPTPRSCIIPTGSITFSIGSNPAISAITSASTFIQVTPGPGVYPTVAPFDLISIFGTNFCSSGATGCSSNATLPGVLNASLIYSTALNEPNSGNPVSVTFYPHDGPYTSGSSTYGSAPLLFVTNDQINLAVPVGVSTLLPAGGLADIVVSFGTGNSAPSTVNIAPNDPGIFAVGTDGQGVGAILNNANYAAVTSSNPAGMRLLSTDSDWVDIYMTGLGVPGSSGGSCITPTAYMTALGLSGAAIDGAVIQSAVLNHLSPIPLAPCLQTLPTVNIGGLPGLVNFAGWVTDSIAGLYQVNVQLPSISAGAFVDASNNPISLPITGPVQLPVQVVLGTGLSQTTSQSNVTIWVTPRLKVTDPDTHTTASPLNTLTETCTVSVSCTLPPVLATGGSGTFQYTLTSGLLPPGLSLSAGGVISGIPAANTGGQYTLTVTATDSSNIPVTGTVTFILTVNADLFMTSLTSGTLTGAFGTAKALTTLTATGGTFPYVYSITSPSAAVPGLGGDGSVVTGGNVAMTVLTPAGTYPLSVYATDSSSPQLNGTFNATVKIGLKMTIPAPATQATGTSLPTICTVTAASGNTSGTIGYTLDATSRGRGFAIDPNSGAITQATAVTAGSYTLTVTATDSGTLPAGATSFGTGTATVSVTITPGS